MSKAITLDLARLSEVGIKPALKRYDVIYPGMGRVWATYPYEAAGFARDLGLAFGGKLSVVPGTVRPTEVAGVLSAVVVPRAARMANAAEAIKTHEMALCKKDTFIDKAGQLWSLEGEGESAQLVAKTKDTVEKCFASQPLVAVDARLYGNEQASLRLGDYVRYLDTAGTMHFGTWLGGPKNLVLNRNNSLQPVEISAKAVIDSVEQAALQPEIQLSLGYVSVETAAGLERLVTFLRRVYGNFPQYWKIWEDKIQDAAKTFNPA